MSVVRHKKHLIHTQQKLLRHFFQPIPAVVDLRPVFSAALLMASLLRAVLSSIQATFHLADSISGTGVNNAGPSVGHRQGVGYKSIMDTWGTSDWGQKTGLKKAIMANQRLCDYVASVTFDSNNNSPSLVCCLVWWDNRVVLTGLLYLWDPK